MKNVRQMFCVLVFCGFSTIISALPAQKLIYPGEWIYDALTALSLEQGIVFFTGTALTVNQIENMLAKIDESALSDSGMAMYERIQAYLNTPNLFSLSTGALDLYADAALQPEVYFKTNETLDWNYRHGDRMRFLMFPAGMAISKYVVLESELYVGENRRISEAHDNYFNFPFDKMIDRVTPIETNMPRRAYLSAGIPLWDASGINFRIGIGEDNIGRTQTDSIVFSDSVKAVNYAMLTFYSPRVKFSSEVKQLEVNKYLYLHNFQIQLFRRFSLGFVEGVMANAPFEIRFLNPMMIFHGFNAWEDNYKKYNEELNVEDNLERIGSYAALVLNWQPAQFIRIYGLGALNQFELPYERGSDSTVPDSLAFQLGFESFIPVPTGHWTFGLEGVYTSPYMYILRHRNWSFYRESRENSNPPIYEWVGTSFGPDAIAGKIWVGYKDTSLWEASLSFLTLVQGENSSFSIFDPEIRPDGHDPQTPEEATALSPTGTPSYTYQIRAFGKWVYSDLLTFSCQTGYTIVQNFGHKRNNLQHGFEISLSVQLFPRALRTFPLTL